MPSVEARELLSGPGLAARHFDERLTCLAMRLRDPTRSSGPSLRDRACLALGHAEAVPVVAMDTKWEGISDAAGVEVILAG